MSGWYREILLKTVDWLLQWLHPLAQYTLNVATGDGRSVHCGSPSDTRVVAGSGSKSNIIITHVYAQNQDHVCLCHAAGYKLGFNYLKAGRFVDAVEVCNKVR